MSSMLMHLHKKNKKNALSSVCILSAAILQASMPSIAVAQDLPTGGTVMLGQATINASNHAMNITQSTPNAVIGWGSFDIANGNSVNFQVPTGGATLNQISGPSSKINGNLTSNGTLFLVNPNGVLFGNGANVNVGSLVTSTSTLEKNDFMNGQYTFTADGKGTISNSGTLTAGSGGYVVLAGAGTIQNEGTITVPGGTIQLVSADAFTLTLPTQNPFLSVTVDGTAKGKIVNNEKAGVLSGGAVTLHAQQGNVRSIGTIQATSIGDLKGSVNIAGADLIISGKTDTDGDINISSSGFTAFANAAVSAANAVNVDAKNSLSVGNSAIKSDSGNINLSSEHTLYVFGNSSLSTNNGDIHLRGKGGGQKFANNSLFGAVNIQDSTLSASSNDSSKGNILLDGQQDASNHYFKAGVQINNSSLNANTIEANGKGSYGVLAEGKNTFNANDILINGDATITYGGHGMGVSFDGNNTLTAQNAITVTGGGDQAGIVFSGDNTFTSPHTRFEGHSHNSNSSENTGIRFSGKLSTQSNVLGTPGTTFHSNDVEVTPVNTLVNTL
ncbi:MULTISPECIES: two-partner secretion domain-containing protein [unclassified Pseudomonas]|uniref:two-partner secretion domain-containing protein n=1 Tax=unclassified Pseudomonas TaxID=196821 RepID=UPI001304F635|nr:MULTISPECIES: filamentous hemagglutinin N-terminal domain-containing protein [unclassified Pseudomonas]